MDALGDPASRRGRPQPRGVRGSVRRRRLLAARSDRARRGQGTPAGPVAHGKDARRADLTGGGRTVPWHQPGRGGGQRAGPVRGFRTSRGGRRAG